MHRKHSLSKCKRLPELCDSLVRERANTVSTVACGSRFRNLNHEEKQLIACMSKELTQYTHYLQTLRDATFLNKYIHLVQSFCQKKTREIYLQLSESVSKAFSSSLDALLFDLRNVYLLHEQLNGYLNCQSFRSWAVGSCHNKTKKYKECFRYNFPECDFERPLVLRNPSLTIDNAAKMFYRLIDVFTKFNGTRAFAISQTDLLWLGRCEETGCAHLKNNECADKLWLCVDSRKPAHTECMTFNAIWFPQFHMYVQFKTKQRRCKNDLFIVWSDTTNCCDQQRQQALLERCQCNSITYELCTRDVVDWSLLCPFTLELSYTQHDGCVCPYEKRHTTTVCGLFEFESVRDDYLMVLCTSSTIRPGTYVNTSFKTCNIHTNVWKPHLNQLIHFYKTVIDTQDMQLLQTESQERQLHSIMDCIRKNIAMYQDLIGDYVNVNNVQAINKIRKLNHLIESIEHLLASEPLKVVASSRREGKTIVIQEHQPKHNSHTGTITDAYTCEQSTHYDRDGDISDFSSGDESD